MDADTKAFVDAIAAEPPGSFKLFRTRDADPAVEVQIRNMAELMQRVEVARRAGCLIEVVSLRLQYIDVWLRRFFDSKASADAQREREFGRLLRQCFELGLEKGLYDRIQQFNNARVKAIHGFLVGATDYDSIEEAVHASDHLARETAAFVVKFGGEDVTANFVNEHHNRGDSLYHVADTLASLAEMPDI
ncbi:hypothetical protein BKK79_00740 [Cupriavidus sp. USMAA2-4]|nr:hypothetical protein BKK79_00740 [Cupriavidus sp. USMAA2-4]